MNATELIAFLSFMTVASLVYLISRLGNRSRRRENERLKKLIRGGPLAIPREELLERVRHRQPQQPNLPESEDRIQVAVQLHLAGIYHPRAPMIFFAAKVLIISVSAVVALVGYLTGMLSTMWALSLAMGGIGLGVLGPSFWLDGKRKRRQAQLTKGLPDMLDIMTVCLEGGLGLPAAIQQIANRFQSAHPALGKELMLVRWEMQLGETVGTAMEHFAARCDIDEVRRLAAMFKQNERYGVGMVTALRAHSEMLRFHRVQQTEERAQRAGAKILFPTLLFIFPAIFVILLGPAAMQVSQVIKTMKRPPAQKSKK